MTDPAATPAVAPPAAGATAPAASPIDSDHPGHTIMEMSEELTSLAFPDLEEPPAGTRTQTERESQPPPTFDLAAALHPPEGDQNMGRPQAPADGRACSRCGQPSEHKLCDACREAFRQLQELSLDLGDDGS